MKTELAPAQIENYQKEGWLIVDDFLAPDELRALNTAVDTGVETMGGNKVSGEHNESIKDDSQTYYNRVFLQRVNLWRVNDDIKNFFLNPTLGEMLCQLADINGIRVWHDQTLRDVDRENFTFIPDTGWWPGSPGAAPPGATLPEIDFYAFMEETSSAATYIRAKIYKIDSGREEWLDYERIVEIISKVDFNGNISIVFEGQGNQCSDREAIGLAVAYLWGLLASV